MITGLEKLQEMRNIHGLQNVGAKVRHGEQAHWIKYRM
jgi:hypothetical protein